MFFQCRDIPQRQIFLLQSFGLSYSMLAYVCRVSALPVIYQLNLHSHMTLDNYVIEVEPLMNETTNTDS